MKSSQDLSFSPYERSPARRYGIIVPHFSQFCKGVCYSFNTIFQKIHRNFEIPVISSAKPFPAGQTNPRICTEGEGVLMPVFGPTRAALAAAAARGADILPSLRLVLTAEALTAPPPSRALELNAELDALCAAVRELADCRAGWLYFCPGIRPAARCRAPGASAGHCTDVPAAEFCAVSAAPPCGWRRSRVLRCWPCRAAIRRGCPATCPRCCTAAGRMSQPPAAVPGPPRCGCRSPPPCPCASRPPRQISCWTATARQRYIWTGLCVEDVE